MPRLLYGTFLLSPLSLFLTDSAFAGEWKLTPSVNVQETYTNNLRLSNSSDDQEGELISDLTPKLELQGKGNRVDVDSSLSVQKIYYQSSDVDDRTNRQASLGVETELVKDWLFLDLRGQLEQRKLSQGGVGGVDILSPDSNYSDVQSTSLSPRLEHVFGNRVALGMNYTERRIEYKESTLGDARVNNVDVQLGRDQGQNRLGWQVSASRDKQWAEDTLTSERQMTRGTLTYRTLDHLSIVLNGGDEKGEVAGSSRFEEGQYWSAGLLWTPTNRFSFQVVTGDNDRSARLEWTPISRSTIEIQYSDRTVGVHPTSAWTGSLSHRSRRTVWSLSHTQEISSDARVLFQEQASGDVAAMGDSAESPLIDLFDVSSESFEREVSQGNVTYTSRKNVLSAKLSKEWRSYEVSGSKTNSSRASTLWRHNLGPRLSTELSYSYQAGDEALLNDSEVVVSAFGVNRKVGRQSELGVDIKRVAYNADDTSSEYVEKRLSAYFKAVF